MVVVPGHARDRHAEIRDRRAVGDELLRLALTPAAPPRDTCFLTLDDSAPQAALERRRQWLATPGAVTSVAILLRDGEDVPAAVQNLRPLLPPFTVPFTWRETSPELDAAVRIDNLGAYLFNAILLAIVALAVLEALLSRPVRPLPRVVVESIDGEPAVRSPYEAVFREAGFRPDMGALVLERRYA